MPTSLWPSWSRESWLMPSSTPYLVDDIFVIWKHGEETLETFVEELIQG